MAEETQKKADAAKGKGSARPSPKARTNASIKTTIKINIHMGTIIPPK